MSLIKKNIIIPAVFFMLTAGFYMFFSHYTPYQLFLKPFVRNWVNNNGKRTKEAVPFYKPNNTNSVQWDAKHYKFIKENGYDTNKAGSDFIFAFFPMFPLIWKLSQLNALGIIAFNYIIFAISMLLLSSWLSRLKHQTNNILLALILPSTIIFLIPYTEALFFAFLSIAIYGLLKNKYIWFFVGLFLASLTRPAYTILGLALFFSELYFLFAHKNIKYFAKRLLKNTLPLIAGTLSVATIQFLYGSNSFFTFIKVQKYWNNILQLPKLNFIDWSHEGFSINIVFIILIFLPITIWLSINSIKKIKTKNNTNHINTLEFLQILSIIYLIGSNLFILLFRGGSLHCLFRFTMCTPFFYVLIFSFCSHIKSKKIYWIYAFLSLVSLFLLSAIPYTMHYSFSDFGGIIFIIAFWLWILKNKYKQFWYKATIIILIGINILWTSYLFSMYLSNGWIFA